MHRARHTPATARVISTRLGALLVAQTTVGVAAVWLGDDATALLLGLRAARPDLDLDAPETVAQLRVLDAVARLADAGVPTPDLPLDLRGTPWQVRVWRALQAIPPGHPRSYSAVAAALGVPGATRAVARAIATNDVALLIPCHRVVRADGAPGGFRWGAHRKALLLEREAAHPSPTAPPPHSPVQP
jgi:AraC family transcriptional regulator of adaptative response/methylated-DNA-[protein]-cysteine methyltransferase